jgi:hypothetical protein
MSYSQQNPASHAATTLSDNPSHTNAMSKSTIIILASILPIFALALTTSLIYYLHRRKDRPHNPIAPTPGTTGPSLIPTLPTPIYTPSPPKISPQEHYAPLPVAWHDDTLLTHDSQVPVGMTCWRDNAGALSQDRWDHLCRGPSWMKVEEPGARGAEARARRFEEYLATGGLKMGEDGRVVRLDGRAL